MRIIRMVFFMEIKRRYHLEGLRFLRYVKGRKESGEPSQSPSALQVRFEVGKSFQKPQISPSF